METGKNDIELDMFLKGLDRESFNKKENRPHTRFLNPSRNISVEELHRMQREDYLKSMPKLGEFVDIIGDLFIDNEFEEKAESYEWESRITPCDFSAVGVILKKGDDKQTIYITEKDAFDKQDSLLREGYDFESYAVTFLRADMIDLESFMSVDHEFLLKAITGYVKATDVEKKEIRRRGRY